MGDSHSAQKNPSGELSAAAANDRKHNDPRGWDTHVGLLKRSHSGNEEVYTSAAAANNRKDNDPGEWETTHELLKSGK